MNTYGCQQALRWLRSQLHCSSSKSVKTFWKLRNYEKASRAILWKYSNDPPVTVHVSTTFRWAMCTFKSNKHCFPVPALPTGHPAAFHDTEQVCMSSCLGSYTPIIHRGLSVPSPLQWTATCWLYQSLLYSEIISAPPTSVSWLFVRLWPEWWRHTTSSQHIRKETN